MFIAVVPLITVLIWWRCASWKFIFRNYRNAMAAWLKCFAESKNYLSGIVRVSSADEPIREINELIRCYEIATRSRFVSYWHQGSFGKRTADILNTDSQKPGHRVTWKLDGSYSDIPLIHCGSCELECHQGPDRFNEIKRKRQEVRKNNENEEHQYGKGKARRFLAQNTKKLDCPARIRMKHVLLFPDYKTDGKSEWKRKQISKKLNSDLRLNGKEACQNVVHEIHVRLPDPTKGHVGHIVGSMEERDDTDNAVEDTFRSCRMNHESMGCPAVSEVKKCSDTLTEEGIDEDMLNNSTLSQEADVNPSISAEKHHFQTHNRRPKSPDQQKHEIEEQGEEGLNIPEDSMSVVFSSTESNNETRPSIEVPIKVDNSHAARDSFSAGSSKSEQRLPLDKVIGEHTLSNSGLSQEIDEKPLITTDTGGYSENCPKIYSGKKPHKCPVCEMFFSNGSDMKKHVQRHTGLKPHKCSVCKKGFYTSSELRCHMPSHTGEKPYSCSLCNSAFSCWSSLKVHTRTHTGEKPFKCQLCMATFSQTGHLRTHIMTHTGEKPYKCSHCDAAFTTGRTLKTHLRTHTGEKPHKCSYCTATFARLDHLRFHIYTHTGEMPYKCQECNSAFARPTGLMLHMRTHTGEKPYRCQECNSAYGHSSGLRRHMKIHTRNKSHKCSYCTATFNSSFHLKSHLKNHADKMSHENDDSSPCDNLESDLQIHKGKKRHECTLCNAVFPRPFALKRHLQTHHQRPRNTDQQKNQTEEIKEEILTVQEDFASVDFLKAESNNEPRPPIQVFIKVEDDAHAACDSFSDGSSESEQRLSAKEVKIKVEETHVASTDFISSCEIPYLQDNKVNVKEEKKEMADQEWTHSAISSL